MPNFINLLREFWTPYCVSLCPWMSKDVHGCPFWSNCAYYGRPSTCPFCSVCVMDTHPCDIHDMVFILCQWTSADRSLVSMGGYPFISCPRTFICRSLVPCMDVHGCPWTSVCSFVPICIHGHVAFACVHGCLWVSAGVHWVSICCVYIYQWMSPTVYFGVTACHFAPMDIRRHLSM